MSSFQETENFQNLKFENIDFNEEDRELEEALSLSDLPITTGDEEDEPKPEEKTQNEEENLNLDFDLDFDFGSLIGSMSALDGEMCAADEIFSGGQILPYRSSVSSITGLRSYSRSESMDRREFGSRSSSTRSSSIRSHYSATSSGGSSCSNNTTISAKTIPMVSKVQNQFHSYPSPKPQIMGPGVRVSTQSSPVGKKSKMWEVLKLGLVRTPEIELQDLKLRHRTNNTGKSMTISNGSSSSSSNNDRVQARKSFSNDGNRITDFVLEMQQRKSQQQEVSENKISNKNGGIFKSCKCSIGVINPIPTKPNYNYGGKSGYFGISNNSNKYGNSQNNPGKEQVLEEDKKLAQKQKHEQQQGQRKINQIRQDKQVMSHHQNRTFEWLKNLSHASVLNS